MGANVLLTTILQAGKAIASVHHVCQQFKLQTSNQVHFHHHPYPSFGKDFTTVVDSLEEENVLVPASVRQHNSFHFKCGLMEAMK